MMSGHIGSDPELRQLEGGSSVLRFRVADNVDVKRQGEWTKHTNWYTVELWNRQAKSAATFLKKGQKISVSGELRIEQYGEMDNLRTDIKIVNVNFDLQERREEQMVGA